MRTHGIRGTALAASLFAVCIGLPAADEKKPPVKAPAKPAAKAPAVPSKAPPVTAGASRGTSAASPAGRGGATTANPGGRTTPATTNGRGAPPMGGRGEAHPAPGGRGAAPGREVAMRNGGNARLGTDGRVRELHSSGMDIHRGPNGTRRIVAERPDHSRVFAERGGRGYVQHPYMFHGHEFASRTYYVNGRAYSRYYGRYPYRGAYLEVYSPPLFYPAPFYGYAYNPWAAPVPYAWGWAGNPWAVYYGGYFAPYPVYPSASFWLTDYMISMSLQAAYQQQAAAAAGAAPPPPEGAPAPLSLEVKQLVSAEVQRQLALENAEAAQNARNADPDLQSSGIARMMTDNTPHVFVASGDLALTDANGQECSVTLGDVLQMLSPPPPPATAAQLIVLASKAQDCRKGSSVSVQLADLQEMQNHMRETIDQGLGEIQSHAGQGGLPALPTVARGTPVPAAFATAAPPPDPNAGAEITQQVQAADQAEKEATALGGPSAAEASPAAIEPPPPTAAPPVEEDLTGKTIDQIIQIKGQPRSTVKAGTKTILTYPDLKLIFVNGKLTDVQ